MSKTEYIFHNLKFEAGSSKDAYWYVRISRVSDGVGLDNLTFSQDPSKDLDHIALEWVLNKAGNSEPTPKFCDACGAELSTVYGDTTYQYQNALWITFAGGYGMAIDPEDEDYKVVICHECFHGLCDVSWIGKLLKPQQSHAHREKFWQEYPEHEGWDKPPYEESA